MANLTPGLARHRHRVHGLVLDSELEFPELARDGDAALPDVVVRFGPVPRNIENPRQSGVCYQARAGEMLMWIDGVARFHVVDGRSITIERQGAVADDAIRAFMLSSPLAALLLQRGFLPLHASAVAMPEGAVVFGGAAAQGKSTLAAECARCGGSVLADDIAALRVGDVDTACVLPGAPVLRLWPDALAAVGANADAPTVRSGVGKQLLGCAGNFSTTPIPLAAIYVLERGEIPSGGALLAPLGHKEALVTLLDLVYRPAFVRGLQLERQVFAQVERLARAARVIRVFVPTDRFEVASLAARITEDLSR